ncbi:MAG: hypothetical protein QXZ45_03825 [Candidatus Nezhaarchaeales archaeon]
MTIFAFYMQIKSIRLERVLKLALLFMLLSSTFATLGISCLSMKTMTNVIGGYIEKATAFSA